MCDFCRETYTASGHSVCEECLTYKFGSCDLCGGDWPNGDFKLDTHGNNCCPDCVEKAEQSLEDPV